MDKIYAGLSAVLDRYKALSMVVLVLILAFPIVTTVAMWAERVGYFTNVYQAEHLILTNLAIVQANIAQQTLAKHDHLRDELILNRGLIQNGAYFQQRTCVNTATNEADKVACLLKPWDRPKE